MSVQTDYDDVPAIAYAGQLATSGEHVIDSNVVETNAITAGLVVLKGTNDGQARPILSSDEIAADTDAIATTLAAAATKAVFATTDLDGVVGQAAFWPPRNVTATLNSHANWDNGTMIVKGYGPRGEPVQEVFEVPDAGAVTLTGSIWFTQILSVELSAMAGAAATFDVGLGLSMGPIDARVLGIAIYDAAKAPGTYADEESVPVLRKGRIYVNAEAAVSKGGEVFVRFVATGGETRGRVRGAPDANDCAPLRGARFAATTSGEGLVPVDLDLAI